MLRFLWKAETGASRNTSRATERNAEEGPGNRIAGTAASIRSERHGNFTRGTLEAFGLKAKPTERKILRRGPTGRDVRPAAPSKALLVKAARTVADTSLPIRRETKKAENARMAGARESGRCQANWNDTLKAHTGDQLEGLR